MDMNSKPFAQAKADKVGAASSQALHKMKSKNDKSSTPCPILLHGTQTASKFNRTIPDEVKILLALYRIESKSVDLVFSANLPVATETSDGLSLEQIDEAKSAFIAGARSLRIVDFSLFV